MGGLNRYRQIFQTPKAYYSTGNRHVSCIFLFVLFPDIVYGKGDGGQSIYGSVFEGEIKILKLTRIIKLLDFQMINKPRGFLFVCL